MAKATNNQLRKLVEIKKERGEKIDPEQLRNMTKEQASDELWERGEGYKRDQAPGWEELLEQEGIRVPPQEKGHSAATKELSGEAKMNLVEEARRRQLTQSQLVGEVLLEDRFGRGKVPLRVAN